MQPVLLAAALLLPPWCAQDLPVISGVGGTAGQVRPSPPPKPATGLPPLPATQTDPRDANLDSPRRLSLVFLEPRPIDEVLALLTTATPFSVAIDTDVSGSFRGELRQLTLREALVTLLAPMGLDFEVRGTVIRVRRPQLQTRWFDLNLLTVQRGLTRTTGAGASATLGSVVIADDVMSRVTDGVRALLSERGRVHVDPRAGLAQVTDLAERLDRVASYIEALHRRSGRQVRLQAQVFEVTLRDAASLDWSLVRRQLAPGGEAPQAGFGADPAALRAALVAQGSVRDLWAPEVTTVHNEPAMVRVATAGGTSLTMTVVAQIAADGIVQLNVAHAWEEPGSLASTTRVSESDTVTRVMDGNTALISGLRRTIPPAAGSDVTHAELVVLLRPTVVSPGAFGSR